jgi:hypothetical protein
MRAERRFSEGVLGLALLALLFGGTGPARAGIIYQQALLNSGDAGPFSELDGQQSADNFTLSSAATVGGAEWFGSYLNLNRLPAGTTSVSFHVRFFQDSGGTPLTNPFYDRAVSATVTDTGMLSPSGTELYQFSADSLPPVTIPGGAQTWVSIVESDASTPVNNWEWADSARTTQDGVGTRFSDGASWGVDTGDDRDNLAFTLLSPAASSAPEPASLTLLATGALGLLGYAWRRRKGGRAA